MDNESHKYHYHEDNLSYPHEPYSLFTDDQFFLRQQRFRPDTRSTSSFPVLLLLLLDVNDFLRVHICKETAAVLLRPRKLTDTRAAFKVNYNYLQVDRIAVKLVSIVAP